MQDLKERAALAALFLCCVLVLAGLLLGATYVIGNAVSNALHGVAEDVE